MTLKGENVLGASAIWISPAKDAGQHMLLHPRRSQAVLNILLRTVLSWHSVAKMHHFFFSVLLKPSQTARLNDMVAKSTTAMCCYPLSSEVVMMPRCQPVKFYNSEQGLNSGQHSGAEVYPTNGLGSLCLLIGIWNKSPITFFQMTARRKLHVLLSYI